MDARTNHTLSVAELLERARVAIETDGRRNADRQSDCFALHRAAAEHIAEAQTINPKLTQRQIGEFVGRSAAWINQLIRWRLTGYKDVTAFGPQAKAARAKAAVQSPTKPKPKPATTSEQAKAQTARAEADRAKAAAAIAKAHAAEAKAKAAKAKADAAAARAYAKARAKRTASSDKAFAGSFGGSDGDGDGKIDRGSRDLLVKFLGMLGSDHAGERDNAACKVEKLRKKLNLGWKNLIVRATS